MALDICSFTPRMRALMHSNYRHLFALRAFIAWPRRPILSNRFGVSACVLRDAGETDVVMR